MKKNYILLVLTIVFCSLVNTAIVAQSGNGHDPDLVLSYTPSGYSAATTMRQDDGYTSFSKNTINNNGGDTELFVNFTFDTSGMSVFCVYTTNSSVPTKSNGISVSGSFSNFADPNRTWTVSIPSSANTAGTTVEYIFYISNTDLASGFGRVTPGGGYQTSWTEGDEIGYRYITYDSNVSGGGNWSSTSTWNSSSVPNSTSTPVEIIGTNAVTLDQDADVQNLILISSSIFNLSGGNGLTINGNLSNSGTLTANSGSSLRVTGTSSGNITYNRNLGTTNWYLISSPVTDQDIDAFASAEGLAIGTGSNRGLGAYNNSTAGWDYYQDGASGTGDFTVGTGRSIKLASSGDISFTGTMSVADVGVSISSNSNGFNLVGNPYPSFIAANNNGDATNNVLKINDSDSDFLTESTIWFWDESTGSYDQINQASSAFYIAPAQGFFVSSNGSNMLSITEEMQSHQSTGSFQRNSDTSRPEIVLT
ncbi:MAG: hypothetical protein JKY02_09205, partial [Flavobacteriaceae bacterium]|nr:hypothetical protein [Flavobacteriaceae bacterium]